MTLAIVFASVASFAAGVLVYGWIGRLRKSDRRPALISSVGKGTASSPESSLRDAVTDLYNRKHLLRRLRDNIARTNREKKRMAVILWDIDGFIDFNNSFGQAEGDRLLAKVAQTIHRSLRPYDEAFRSGPDEFCALLLPADEQVAAEVTQRVGQIVSRNLFEGNTEYAGRSFSISSGLVFYPGEYKLPEALLHAAGQELYKSCLNRKVPTL